MQCGATLDQVIGMKARMETSFRPIPILLQTSDPIRKVEVIQNLQCDNPTTASPKKKTSIHLQGCPLVLSMRVWRRIHLFGAHAIAIIIF